MKTIKKIIALISIIFLFSCCATTTFSNEWDAVGLSFSYPVNLTVSIDVFEPYYNGATIFVEQKPITAFIHGCVETDKWRDETVSEYELENKYKDILRQIRDGAINEGIEKFDSLSCNSTMGNIKTTQFKVGNTNGIIYNKALAQDVGSMTVFYTQVLLVDSKDMVYSIVFPYGFGANAEYIDSIRDEYGGAYPKEHVEEKWDEVFSFFKYDKTISSTELQGFSANRKIIEKMIETIKVD